ncbi:signal transduction histidine kinase [Oxalobacteraceae bacterium GrIS 1.11]
MQAYVQTLFGALDGYRQSMAQFPVTPSHLARVAEPGFIRDNLAALMGESIAGLRRVKGIVQSLKDIAHIGESDGQYADLHHGIDSTLNVLSHEIRLKASIVKHYAALALALALVKCLAPQINQVFMNLLVNPVHAIDGTGVITIRSGCEQGVVWIEFGDTGSGIEAQNLACIVEPFFTIRPAGSGTGLGLSTSSGIVKKHGGRIDVDSAPGQGARFTLHLPIDGPKSACEVDVAG